MRPIHATLRRFRPSFGWTDRLLRIDLSQRRIWAEETTSHVPAFIGARGLAAKLLWDEYPEPVEPFDARNPLMIIPGALTGTIAPYSGRTNVCSFSPQSSPYNWFTRSSIGADWGAKLKRAGYDGVVITGSSERPVQILIQDDEVSILPAEDLWGLDSVETQEAAKRALGKTARTLAIGPAGEHLSRIATIQTATGSASGQAGFGAVMGSKRLKSVTVVASGQVSVANPERLHWLFQAVGEEVRSHRNPRRRMEAINQELQRHGGGEARPYACTASCPSPCYIQYSGVPGCQFDRKWMGAMGCVSGIFRGGLRNAVYDWELTLPEALELNLYANRLGLNHWDILVGMVPWLRKCHKEGMLGHVNGHAFDLNSSEFWAHLLHDTAHRQGIGDALAEGGWRAALSLSLGVEFMRRYYTGWGYAGHWDGHAAFVNRIVFPFWLVGALHWAMDTRDPASSTHDYVQNVMYWGPLNVGRFARRDTPAITWDHMRGIGQRLYGRADTLDPLSGYEGKAIPAAYHGVRAIMKDCLPTDDQVFPLIYSYNTEDRFCRIGDFEGPDVDAAILRTGTGLDWDTAEFAHAAERVLNLERAITIRHWGRTRAMDERVLPCFEYDENWVNPELGQRRRLDRAQFAPVMDEYYRLRGWDPQTGWPTRDTLERLDLPGVYRDMVAGAAMARTRLPDLPPERPVQDHHHLDPDRTNPAPP